MEQLLSEVFSEKWIVYLLFFMIVGWFIWRWVPYLFTSFEKIITAFLATIKEMQEQYKLELKEIRETFIVQIEKSNSWHDKHAQNLDEIKSLLKK